MIPCGGKVLGPSFVKQMPVRIEATEANPVPLKSMGVYNIIVQ